jgi:ElaB/YqjD/DUF883 family membrane-anchored ribosome-binding protein
MNDTLAARRASLASDLRLAIEDAQALLRDTGDLASEEAGAARERIKALLGQARDTMLGLEEATVAKANAAAQATNAQVRQHPWESVGIAAGVGLLLGLLIGRR